MKKIERKKEFYNILDGLRDRPRALRQVFWLWKQLQHESTEERVQRKVRAEVR